MITLKRTDGSIIAECDTDSLIKAVEMHKADLREANLHEANLRGANLYEADLEGADLYEADLRGADLREANLLEADLCGADLRGADLREANLLEAFLWEADLRGASNILSLGPIGSEGRIIYIVNHGDKIMVKAGCFWGDLEEFKKAVEEKHGTNEHGVAYMATIEFIKAYAKAYKWSEVKDQ